MPSYLLTETGTVARTSKLHVMLAETELQTSLVWSYEHLKEYSEYYLCHFWFQFVLGILRLDNYQHQFPSPNKPQIKQHMTKGLHSVLFVLSQRYQHQSQLLGGRNTTSTASISYITTELTLINSTMSGPTASSSAGYKC